MEEEAIRLNSNATNQFIGALTEMVWHQIGMYNYSITTYLSINVPNEMMSLVENVTMDLESFSRHAGRSTITTDDVLLVTRRNDALHDIIKDFIDKEKAKSTNEGGKSRTNN